MLKDYKGQAAIEDGEAFDPSPANIDARTIRVTLPNGMKLALLAKKTRGATVTAILTMHYGDEKIAVREGRGGPVHGGDADARDAESYRGSSFRMSSTS